MAPTNRTGKSRERPAPPPSMRHETAPLRAWEVVERGRYRPLRTRGSFPGRELG